MSSLSSILSAAAASHLPSFQVPKEVVTFNAPPEEAKVIILLEPEHNNTEYGEINASIADRYGQDGDLALIEGDNDPSSSIYQKTLFKLTKALIVRPWDDPEEMIRGAKKADQILTSTLSELEKERELDDYIRSTFSIRQDRLIDQIFSNLGKWRKILVFLGSQHGNILDTLFFEEVEKLLKFLSSRTTYCIFDPKRVLLNRE